MGVYNMKNVSGGNSGKADSHFQRCEETSKTNFHVKISCLVSFTGNRIATNERKYTNCVLAVTRDVFCADGSHCTQFAIWPMQCDKVLQSGWTFYWWAAPVRKPNLVFHYGTDAQFERSWVRFTSINVATIILFVRCFIKRKRSAFIAFFT